VPDIDQLPSQLAAISARLKEIGEEGLVRELSRQIGQAVAPVPGKIRAGLKPHLPDRYAEVLDADTNIGRRTTTTPDGTQVIIYATNKSLRKRRLQRLDDGILWHPLFGRFPRRDPRNRWFEQEVQPGWFTGPVEEAAPQVRDAIQQALDEVVRKAVGQ
jgi:hypothetical protein